MQRRVGMRIIENTISDINEALAREFLGRVQRPAQLVVNREGAVFVREAQLHFVVYCREGIELSSSAQHGHFLLDQGALDAARKTGANSEKVVFTPQCKGRSNGRHEKRLAKALERQPTVWLIR